MLCFGMSRVSPTQTNEQAYKRTVSKSKQSIQAGKYSEAEVYAQESLKLAKSSQEKVSALNILGETFYRRKSYDLAISQWGKSISHRDVASTLAHLGLARSYKAKRNFAKAIPEYKYALSGFAQKDASYARMVISLAIANSYFESKDFNLAEKYYGQVLKSSQNQPALYSFSSMKLGEIDINRNRFGNALSRLKQVLDKGGLTPEVVDHIQRKIRVLDVVVSVKSEKSEINDGVKIKVRPDDKLNSFIDTVVDNIIDKVIVEAL